MGIERQWSYKNCFKEMGAVMQCYQIHPYTFLIGSYDRNTGCMHTIIYTATVATLNVAYSSLTFCNKCAYFVYMVSMGAFPVST